MIFKVHAHHLINHAAIVAAATKEEARQKYLDEEWEWDEVEKIQVLEASINVERDGPHDTK